MLSQKQDPSIIHGLGLDAEGRVGAHVLKAVEKTKAFLKGQQHWDGGMDESSKSIPKPSEHAGDANIGSTKLKFRWTGYEARKFAGNDGASAGANSVAVAIILAAIGVSMGVLLMLALLHWHFHSKQGYSQVNLSELDTEAQEDSGLFEIDEQDTDHAQINHDVDLN